MARFPHFCLSLLVCMNFSDSPLSATPTDVDQHGQTNPFYQLQISSNGLVTLLGTGTGTGIGTNRKYSMLWKCSHWLEIGNGTRAYCFLLCQSRSLYRSCARSPEVWVYHNRVIFLKENENWEQGNSIIFEISTEMRSQILPSSNEKGTVELSQTCLLPEPPKWW